MFIFTHIIYSKKSNFIFLILGGTVALDAQRITTQAAELKFTTRTIGWSMNRDTLLCEQQIGSEIDNLQSFLGNQLISYVFFYKLYKSSLKLKKQAEPEV